MDFGIYCIRTGGTFGYAAAWMKEDGRIWTTEDKAEAEAKVAQITKDLRSPNVQYSVREYMGF